MSKNASKRQSIGDLEAELRGRGHAGARRVRNQAKQGRRVSMLAAVKRRLHGVS